MNTLYHGDNLKILRPKSEPPALAGGRVSDTEPFGDTEVDSPPAPVPPAHAGGSDETNTLFFKDESGVEADSLERPLEDTWHWRGIGRADVSRADSGRRRSRPGGDL